MIITNSLFQTETPSYRPFNAITKRPYTGADNIIVLTIAARKLQTRDPRWLTFLQAKEKGYKIKKGSHGVRVEFWSEIQFKENEAKNGETSTDVEPRKKLMRKIYTVFHASQVEGIEAYESEN